MEFKEFRPLWLIFLVSNGLFALIGGTLINDYVVIIMVFLNFLFIIDYVSIVNETTKRV